MYVYIYILYMYFIITLYMNAVYMWLCYEYVVL